MGERWEYKLLHMPVLAHSIRQAYAGPEKDAPQAYRGEPILQATPPDTGKRKKR